TSVSSPKRQTAEAVRRSASRELRRESSVILHVCYSCRAHNTPCRTLPYTILERECPFLARRAQALSRKDGTSRNHARASSQRRLVQRACSANRNRSNLAAGPTCLASIAMTSTPSAARADGDQGAFRLATRLAWLATIRPSSRIFSPLLFSVAPVVVMSTTASATPAAGAPSVAPVLSMMR